ncbi:MAG: hypothetical protein PR2021_2490 [Candidatus Phytoplasma pruni]|nr:MAG: hypothetical protein PR2021_2490 [Candidatus Phytoplasma pruni]
MHKIYNIDATLDQKMKKAAVWILTPELGLKK